MPDPADTPNASGPKRRRRPVRPFTWLGFSITIIVVPLLILGAAILVLLRMAEIVNEHRVTEERQRLATRLAAETQAYTNACILDARGADDIDPDAIADRVRRILEELRHGDLAAHRRTSSVAETAASRMRLPPVTEPALLALTNSCNTKLQALVDAARRINPADGAEPLPADELRTLLALEVDLLGAADRVATELNAITQRRAADLITWAFGLAAAITVLAFILFYLLILMRRLNVGLRETARERKAAEDLAVVANQKLRALTRVQDAILNSTDHVIISTDERGRIRTCNDAARRMLGYGPDELIGTLAAKLIVPDDQEDFNGLAARARDGAVERHERTFIRADGSRFPGHVTITAMRGDDEQVSGFVGLIDDITEQRRVLEDLHRTRDLAESANQAKSQFLASMSHELRTPLNAILGYTYLLQQEVADQDLDALAPDLGRIHSAGNHLLALINEILDLSKIESGRVDLHPEPIDLPDLARSVAALVEPQAARGRNTITLDLEPDLPVMHHDLTRTRQILFNLLANACKFTEDGVITLSIATDRECDMIRFQIADTGIGMTPEQLERVFDEFAQADSSTTRKYGGTGLGLTICRRFCDIMGGTIGAESAPGEGATFTVRLPIEHRPATAEPETPA